MGNQPLDFNAKRSGKVVEKIGQGSGEVNDSKEVVTDCKDAVTNTS